MRLRAILPVLLILLGLALPHGVEARSPAPPDPEQFRVGVSFGGISFIGVIFEYRWGNQSIDLNVGTWAFRDLSLSLVAKQYFGPGDLRPFAGIGFWTVIAPYHGLGEREGIALMARAPVGAEWRVDADHHLGMAISLNRALWIQRKDPQDDTPPSDRLIPLPGFSYRWKR